MVSSSVIFCTAFHDLFIKKNLSNKVAVIHTDNLCVHELPGQKLLIGRKNDRRINLGTVHISSSVIQHIVFVIAVNQHTENLSDFLLLYAVENFILLLQNQLNMETSDVISTYVYRIGILDAQYSYTTAIGLFNSVVNVIVLVIVNTIAGKLSDTSLW